jgi:hypothetical protein
VPDLEKNLSRIRIQRVKSTGSWIPNTALSERKSVEKRFRFRHRVCLRYSLFTVFRIRGLQGKKAKTQISKHATNYASKHQGQVFSCIEIIYSTILVWYSRSTVYQANNILFKTWYFLTPGSNPGKCWIEMFMSPIFYLVLKGTVSQKSWRDECMGH